MTNDLSCPGLAELLTRLDRSVDAGDLDDCNICFPATPDGRHAETTKSLSFHE